MADIDIQYEWSMPNYQTFKIKPISKFIKTNGVSIDPFSNRRHNFATIHNDINPNKNVDFNMCALDFLRTFDDNSVDCVLYDPPYSLRQLKEVYDGIGLSLNSDHTTTFFRDIKNEIQRVVKFGGLVYSFGWDSVGMSKKRGFEKLKLLLVCHGGSHHDTICIKEVKRGGYFLEF